MSPKFQPVMDGAAWEFAHLGFKRTQMSDIARTAGVALGTLYRYTRSKEALFYLALQRGFGADLESLWAQLHDPPPTAADILRFVRRRCVESNQPTQLQAILDRPTPGDAMQELRVIAAELYDGVDRLHLAVRILDRSVREWPELLACFVDEIRTPRVGQLIAFLESRCGAGTLLAPPDISAAARCILEICVTFAMHRHFTPGGNYTPDETARRTALHFILNTFDPTLIGAGRSELTEPETGAHR